MKFHLFTPLYELFILFLLLPKVLKAVLHLLPAQPTLAKVTIDFEKAIWTVPYMMTNWRNAIRAKRRALATYQNDKSDSNWDALHIWRNEATRQRRIAIKSYWKSKSDHLKEKPADF